MMSKRTVAAFLLGSLTMTILLIHFFVMEIPITSYWRDSDMHSVRTEALRQEPPGQEQGPRNSTLGFQKIFYVNLPQ